MKTHMLGWAIFSGPFVVEGGDTSKNKDRSVVQVVGWGSVAWYFPGMLIYVTTTLYV